MKITVLKFLLIVFLINIPAIESYAQKPSLKKELRNMDKGKGREIDKDKKDKGKKSIPIDGGIGLLLLAGLGLGARKFVKRKKNIQV